MGTVITGEREISFEELDLDALPVSSRTTRRRSSRLRASRFHRWTTMCHRLSRCRWVMEIAGEDTHDIAAEIVSPTGSSAVSRRQCAPASQDASDLADQIRGCVNTYMDTIARLVAAHTVELLLKATGGHRGGQASLRLLSGNRPSLRDDYKSRVGACRVVLPDQ